MIGPVIIAHLVEGEVTIVQEREQLDEYVEHLARPVLIQRLLHDGEKSYARSPILLRRATNHEVKARRSVSVLGSLVAKWFHRYPCRANVA